jgi:hypothetical protein
MANSFYDAFLNGILGSHATRVDLDADTIKMALCDNGGADGAPAPTTDDFWDDQDGNLIGTAYTLAARRSAPSPSASSTTRPIRPRPSPPSRAPRSRS